MWQIEMWQNSLPLGAPLIPPPLPATLVGNAKEADVWFGRELRAKRARGKFKDLVVFSSVFMLKANALYPFIG